MIPEADMRAALTEILEDDDHYFTVDWTPELAVESAVDALMQYILEAAAPHLMAQAWDEGSREGYKERALENDATGRYGNSTVKDNPYRSQP